MPDECWTIEILDCFDCSNIPSSVGDATASCFEQAARVVREELANYWRANYSKCFSQKNLLGKFLAWLDCPSMAWTETIDPKPKEPYYGELFGPPPVLPPAWVGCEQFLAHLKKHGRPETPELMQALVNKWIEGRETEFQWPVAEIRCNGKDMGCACYALKFSLEDGFVFEISSDI